MVCQFCQVGKAAERGWSCFWRDEKSRRQRSRIGRRRSARRLRSTRVVWHDAAAIQGASDQQPNTFPTTLVRVLNPRIRGRDRLFLNDKILTGETVMYRVCACCSAVWCESPDQWPSPYGTDQLAVAPPHCAPSLPPWSCCGSTCPSRTSNSADILNSYRSTCANPRHAFTGCDRKVTHQPTTSLHCLRKIILTRKSTHTVQTDARTPF